MENTKQRNYAMDILRVLACYMVIQVHTGEFYYISDGNRVASGEGPYVVGFLNSLFRTAVPLFVMISGYFLLPMRESVEKFFSKRFTRVAIPFILWCVLYSFYYFLCGDISLKQAFINIPKIAVNYGVELNHLWYIYMLIGLYLFVPIISPFLRTAAPRHIRFYLYLWAFTLCVPYIHMVFPAILGECFWNKTPMLYYFSGFLGYMVLAFYIRKFVDTTTKSVGVMAWLMISIGYVFTTWGFESAIGHVEHVFQLEWTWLFESINVGFMTVGIFLLFERMKITKEPGKTMRFCVDVSKYSYGIYLVHIMILNTFYAFYEPLINNFWLKIPLVAISTLVVSYIVIKLLSYLPKSKYIVG